jgi:hypothetical protein
MARWKLMTPHYLNVEGEEWEYQETNRTTGRPQRTKFPVPRLLDIRDPQCWTNQWGNKDNAEGEIIVCYKGKGDPKDIVFTGDPTPDMYPVDDEAKEISAKFETRWGAKPENMAGDFSQSLIDKFQTELAMVQSKPAEIPGMTDLIANIGKLAEVNQKVLESAARRV